jgi:hypothetical protein
MLLEPALDALEPLERHAAVRVHVRQDVARRLAPGRFARHDEPFDGLFHHAHARYGARHGARLIGAGIVDDEDFIGRARL